MKNGFKRLIALVLCLTSVSALFTPAISLMQARDELLRQLGLDDSVVVHTHEHHDGVLDALVSEKEDIPFDLVYPDAFEDGDFEYDSSHLLLKLDGEFDGELTAELSECGFSALQEFGSFSDGVWYRALLSEDAEITESAKLARQIDYVKVVDYDYLISGAALDEFEVLDNVASGASLVSEQWYLNSINAGRAWAYLESQGMNPGGDVAVTVAVIDSGVDYTHPELASSMWVNSGEIPGNGIDDDKNGYIDDIHGVSTAGSAYGKSGNPMDENGHGTHVAGIIAAADDGNGVVGIAHNVKIMAIKATDKNDALAHTDVAEALTYAYKNGADVINMSFGSYSYSLVLKEAIAAASESAIIVAAAGNGVDGVGVPNEKTAHFDAMPHYSAAFEGVIGVMSVGESGKESVFSNWDVTAGNSVEYEIYAPGEDMLSTLPDGKYGYMDGTSMSTPVITAIAALLRSQYPDKEKYPSQFIEDKICYTSGKYSTCLGETHSLGDSNYAHNRQQIADAFCALTQEPDYDGGSSDVLGVKSASVYETYKNHLPIVRADAIEVHATEFDPKYCTASPTLMAETVNIEGFEFGDYFGDFWNVDGDYSYTKRGEFWYDTMVRANVGNATDQNDRAGLVYSFTVPKNGVYEFVFVASGAIAPENVGNPYYDVGFTYAIDFQNEQSVNCTNTKGVTVGDATKTEYTYTAEQLDADIGEGRSQYRMPAYYYNITAYLEAGEHTLQYFHLLYNSEGERCLGDTNRMDFLGFYVQEALFGEARENYEYPFVRTPTIGYSAGLAFNGDPLLAIDLTVIGIGECKERRIKIPDTVLSSYGSAQKVKYIGSNVFAGAKVASVELPLYVEKINNQAFYRCEYLERVSFANKDTSLAPTEVKAGQHAFFECTRLKTFEGNYAFSLAEKSSFARCYMLEDVVLSESISAIFANAFYECRSLEEITIPDNVSLLYEFAFYGCSSLKNVNISSRSKLQTVGNSAFNGCTSLESFVFPNSVTLAGEYVFSGCTSLKSVTFSSALTEVRLGFFMNCTSLTEVHFSDDFNMVLKRAFSGCTALKTIGSNVELDVVEDEAFLGCSSLESINLSPELEEIGMRVFYNCSSLESIKLPRALTEIHTEAFAGCTSLKSVTLPDSLETLREHAFADCTSLTLIKLGSGLQYAYDGVFSGCTGLEEIQYNVETLTIFNSTEALFANSGTESGGMRVVIGPDAKNIPYGVFNKTNVVSIKAYDQSVVCDIAERAFEWCTALESVELYGVFRANSFAYCTAVRDVYLNTEFSQGEASAYKEFFEQFGEKDQPLRVVIGKKVNYIPEALFSYSFVTEVSFETESNCTQICANAFAYCYYLPQLMIPKSVTSVGSHAFDIYGLLLGFAGEIPFGFTYNGDDAYKIGYASNVMRFVEYDGVTYAITCSGEARVMRFETDGDTVTIPSKVEGCAVVSIGMNVFAFHSFDNIICPTTLKTIDDYAFCYNGGRMLKTIVLNDGLTRIGNNAFYGVELTEDLYIPSSVTSIGSQAFKPIGASRYWLLFEGETLPVGSGPFDGRIYYLNVKLKGEVGDWGYILTNDNEATVIYYNGDEAYVSIPAKIGGAPVTVLWKELLNDRDGLRAVWIPGTVREIQSKALVGNWTEYRAMVLMFEGSELPETLADDWTKYTRYRFNISEMVGVGDLLYGVKKSGTAICCMYYGESDRVEIPETVNGYTVTEIGESMFENTSNVKEVTLPKYLSVIGSKAFSGLGIEAIVIPKSVCEIAEDAFKNCYHAIFGFESEDPSSEILDATVEMTFNNPYYTGVMIMSSVDNISYYVGTNGEAVIYSAKNVNLIHPYSYALPAEVGGYPVVKIADGAFSRSKLPAEVIIPGSVKVIGANAFEYNDVNIVRFEEGVEWIGNSVFWNCKELRAILMPESVTYIGTNFFSNLQKATVCYAGSVVPAWASGNTQSVVLDVTSVGALEDAIIVIFKDGRVELLAYFGDAADYTVPSEFNGAEIEGIWQKAFFGNTTLVNIIIPDTVKVIGTQAFSGCTSLQSVTLGEGIESIENNAFYGCTSLERITLPEGIGSIGTGIFALCSSLVEVELPKSLSVIPGKMFYCCAALTELPLHEGITEIGSNAFYGCTALTELHLHEGITAVGSSAFKGCTALESITLPDSLVSIDSNAFENCTAITAVTLSKNIQSLGSQVFRGCTSLGTVYYYIENLQSVSSSFERTSFDLVIGANVRAIPNRLCDGSLVKSVTFEEGSVCEKIGDYAFEDCTALKAITLPNSVTSIGRNAFAYCSALETVDLPMSLEAIGEYAFRNCTLLTEFTVPENVTSLGSRIIYDCTSVKTVYMNAKNCKSGSSGTFSGVEFDLVIGKNVINLGDNIFRDSGVKSVIFEEGSACETLGIRLFNNCKLLTAISLPEKVTAIGSYAFDGCTTLAEITLPDGLKTIAHRAFNNCIALTELEISGEVNISSGAFLGCTSLTRLIVDSTSFTPAIGGHDLNFGSLTTVLYPKSVVSDVELLLKHYQYVVEVTHRGRELFACSNHEHVWSATSIERVPCTTDGFVGDACDVCGLTNGEFTDRHNYVITDLGVGCFLALVCSDCGKIAKIYAEHQFNVIANIVPPTCTEDGYTVYRCANCNETEIRDITDALGHDFSVVHGVIDPTCTEIGHTVYKCVRCEETELRDSADALGHDFSVVHGVIDPTCTEIGHTVYKCVRCEETELRDGADALGHDFSTVITEVLPTCTQSGYIIYECSRCDQTERKGIPSLKHDYSEILEIVDPTCTEGGHTVYKCVGCDLTVTRDPTDALGHDVGAITEEVKPTCTEGGYVIYECSRCDHTEREELSSLGHDYSVVLEVIDPTCTQSGRTVYKCVRCDLTRIGNVINALRHDYSVLVEEVEQSCTEGGRTVYKCVRCELTRTSNVTNALGHDYSVLVEEVEQSCTEGGHTVYKCVRCELTRTSNVTNALGHNYSVLVEKVEQSCTEGGYTLYKCVRCDATEKRDVTPKTNHIYDGIMGCSECGTQMTPLELWDVSAAGDGSVTARLYGFDDDSAYVVEISGSGDMKNWSVSAKAPWYISYRRKIVGALITDKVTSVGKYAFYYCTALESVSLADSVTEIRSDAFSDCSSLKEITLHEGITVIQYNAFTKTGLERIKFPESLEKIGNHAFSYTKLRSVTLPEGLLSIDAYAFGACTMLEEIRLLSESVQISGSNSAFITSSRENAIRLYVGPKVKSIPSYLFGMFGQGAPNIVSVEFAKGSACTEIGAYAFQNCTKLECVYITSSVLANGLSSYNNVSSMFADPMTFAFSSDVADIPSYVKDKYKNVSVVVYGGETYTVYSKCTHVFVDVTVDSDCEVEGFDGSYCTSCGLRNGDSIERHKWIEISGNPCESGYICGECGETKYMASTHSYKIIEIAAPTCTERGYTLYVCEVCQDRKESDYKSALGHDCTEVIERVIPTCVNDGYTLYGCTRCDLTEKRDLISAISHSFNEDKVCEGCGIALEFKISWDISVDGKGGLIAQLYANEDDSVAILVITGSKGMKSFEMGSAPWHEKYSAAIVEVDASRATGTNIGSYAFFELINMEKATISERVTHIESGAFADCSRLAEFTVPSKVIHIGSEAFIHSGITRLYVESRSVMSALTSHVAGGNILMNITYIAVPKAEINYVASFVRNSYTYQDEVYYNGKTYTVCSTHEHNWVVGECLQEGIPGVSCPKYEYICDMFGCGLKNVSKSEAHNIVSYPRKAPTCTEIGWNAYEECTYCDHSTYVELAIVPHTYGKWQYETVTSCVTDGVQRRDCEYCDHYETKTIEAYGHDIVSYPGKAPTCSSVGWDAYEKCLACDYTTYNELPVTDHDFSDVIMSAPPTCTSPGYSVCRCTGCDEVESVSFDELGHDLVTHPAKAPTCTESGWNAYETCTRCSYSTYVELSAGHSLTLNSGHTCDMCGYSKTPSKPTLLSKTANSITLNPLDGFEYSLDKVNWQDSNVFNGLEGKTSYRLYQRVKGNGFVKESEISFFLTVWTDAEQPDPEQTYQIVFKNWDGTVISSNTYRYGETVVVPNDPTRSADNKYRYTFTGWDKTVVSCVGDATYTATYSTEYIEYTVVFKDWDGRVISTKSYRWGDRVTAPSSPVREPDGDHYFEFIGWGESVVPCNGDKTYTATYHKTAITLDRIVIATLPDKLTYSEGESFDATGMKVIAYYNYGDERVITDYTVSGFTSSHGTKTVTVAYNGKTASFKVTVNKNEPEYMLGDINGNGEIDKYDYILVKRSCMDTVSLNDGQILSADVNRNGKVEKYDYILIKRHVLKTYTIVQPLSADSLQNTASAIWLDADVKHYEAV